MASHMRYFKLHLTPPAGAFHPADQVMAEHSNVQREALLHVNLLQDGNGVALYLMQGEPNGLESSLEGQPGILSFDVFNVNRDVFNVHLHFEPDSPATDLLEIAEEYKLLIDPPLEFTRNGGLLISVAGTQESIRQAAAALPKECGRVSLERMGKYDPERDSFVEALTERQRHVLATAVELGYYSTPRSVTHEDIADELDCSAGTVGEHLRKVEAKVLAELGSSVGRAPIKQT